MDYHLNSQGQSRGVFPLEELQRRRAAGQLTGTEYVWCKGMPTWQPLDHVLRAQFPGTQPPPIPQPVLPTHPQSDRNSRAGIWAVAILIVFTSLVALACWGAQRALTHWMARLNHGQRTTRPSQKNYIPDPDAQGMEQASEPIIVKSNAVTATAVCERERKFCARQWIDGYARHGYHTNAWDAKAVQFLQDWQTSNFRGKEVTNAVRLDVRADQLATESDDPLILTATAINCGEKFAAVHRYEAALAAYPAYSYQAYPELFTTVSLADRVKNELHRVNQLDANSLRLLERGFKDGSFLPPEQDQLAEFFVCGAGQGLFTRNEGAVCAVLRGAGKDYEWLAQVMTGESEINEAWRQRGSGYADTVSEAGWQGFREHLALARTNLTRAWQAHPELPMAPARMMTVALGSSDPEEMRQWFDRAVSAQFDYPAAWSKMRWGLRPRWYGSHAGMLAMGKAAVKTGRFDTDVPRTYFDAITEVEGELQLPLGDHIYGQEDIWPDLQKMYEGYIAQQPDECGKDCWRMPYAAVAYFAGRYDIAQKQFAALQQNAWTNTLYNWGRDMSLAPLETAARAGLAGRLVGEAEQELRLHQLALAEQRFTALQTNSFADALTRAFIESRLAQLKLEQRLEKGGWVDLLPAGTNDPGWVFSRGQYERAPDGSVEVSSDKDGHLFYCRARVGANFEARGEFEVVRSSSKAFQAGLVMGRPEFQGNGWAGFRVKRNDNEGDVVSFSRGWYESRISQSAILNDRTNAFTFRLQGAKVYASLNGHELINGATRPDIYVSPDEFMVGLGAFNDSNDTVIRYRNVQVRQLPKH